MNVIAGATGDCVNGRVGGICMNTKLTPSFRGS